MIPDDYGTNEFLRGTLLSSTRFDVKKFSQLIIYKISLDLFIFFLIRNIKNQ